MYKTLTVVPNAIVKSSQFHLTLAQISTHLLLSLNLILVYSSSNYNIICSMSSLLIGLFSSVNFGMTIVKTQVVVWIFNATFHFSRENKRKQQQIIIIFDAVVILICVFISIRINPNPNLTP